MTLRPALALSLPYFALSAMILVLDQATKVLAHAQLRGRGAVEVIPDLFNLWYSRNPGGLFGYFRDLGDPWRTLLLTLLPVVAIGMIGYFLLRGDATDRPTQLGLSLILGGATGNLIDRVFRGEVIDFLDVYAPPSGFADWLVSRFGTSHWPTFNVADSAIVVGACLLASTLIRTPRPVPSAETSGSTDPARPGQRV